MGNWLELKSDVPARLRASLVIVLTMALLFGPCLSIRGLAGTGGMHVHAPQTMADAHDHMAAGHAGHTGAINSDTGTKAPPGCEEMCDGRAIQKSKHDPSLGIIVEESNGFDHDSAGDVARVLAGFSLEPPDIRQSPALLHRQDSWLAILPAYSATNRYRL